MRRSMKLLAQAKRDEDEAQKDYEETTMSILFKKRAVAKHHTLESRGPFWDLTCEWCFATALSGGGPGNHAVTLYVLGAPWAWSLPDIQQLRRH